VAGPGADLFATISTVSKKTVREWTEKIQVELRVDEKKLGCYRATCPICSATYSVDVLRSAIVARMLAVQEIERHVRDSHKEYLTDPMGKAKSP
jgi:hypothetical protein